MLVGKHLLDKLVEVVGFHQWLLAERVEMAFGILRVVGQSFCGNWKGRSATQLFDLSCRYSSSMICRNLRSSIEGARLLSLAV